MKIKEKKGLIEAYNENGDKIAGLVYKKLNDEQAYLNLVAVKPEYRKQGILNNMYSIFENKMREQGIKTIELDTGTDEDHRVIRNFAKKRGYQIPSQEEMIPRRLHIRKDL